MTQTIEMEDIPPSPGPLPTPRTRNERRPLMSQTSQNLRDIFNRFDENGDGHITPAELRELLRSADVRGHIPTEKLNLLIAVADRNNDNRLDYNEFVHLVRSGALPPNVISRLANKYIHTLIPSRHDYEGDLPDGEYEEQYRCWPPPFALIILSIVELLMFVIDVSITNDPYSVNGPIASATIYDPYRRYEAWRFISYTLVHVGWMHICVNLGVLLLLGIPLEMVHRWWRVLTVFFSGVVAGSLLTSVTDPRVYLAGASGGVYAIMTSHLATIIMNWSEMTFPLIQLIVFGLIIAVDFGSALYTRYIAKVETQVGYMAHLGGAIAGLLVGIYILRNLQKKKWEKWLCWIAMGLYAVLLAICIIWNVAFPDYFPPPRYYEN